MGDSLCSLVEAVAYANGAAEPDCAPSLASGTTTIDIQASASRYAISSVLSITKNTIIAGAGAANTIIDGGGATQVFNIAANVQVTISAGTRAIRARGAPRSRSGAVRRRTASTAAASRTPGR
jgi:hypothetical protein